MAILDVKKTMGFLLEQNRVSIAEMARRYSEHYGYISKQSLCRQINGTLKAEEMDRILQLLGYRIEIVPLEKKQDFLHENGMFISDDIIVKKQS